ncbi:MAG TPA: SMP-30/gluconolactonase/LRE family protein [Thermoanaerobaculia bacterium]|nr:SMP-30/gluconolactonase/LRE family protein [Thermoanaerobaculia bacterium]
MRAAGFLAVSFLTLPLPSLAADLPREPEGTPRAVVDLATTQGTRLVNGTWRYSDARIVEADFRAAGSDRQPTGAPVRTWDVEPHAGGLDFDDSSWTAVAPESLDERRGNGRLSFAWYRINVTLPPRVGDFDTKGSTVVFATSLDDYAEVWVDGELPRRAGQSGGSMVKGWNAVNRLVVTRHAKPGQKIQLAVFGANGPLSQPPTNFIWMRMARLELYEADGAAGPYAVDPHEVNVDVVRLDPALDEIVPPNPKVYKLADGFQFTEGPIWVKDSGYLLFSDPNANTIYEYEPSAGTGRLSVYRERSGYQGADVAEYGQPGSNGLTLDREGRLTVNEHGNHRVSRLERNGALTVLADRFQGKRLNSPNDLVYRSDGALFFTDPPFGLPRFENDPRKELPYSGVFALVKGRLKLVTKELSGPNGIAFSPDEKRLYVGNWDEKKKVVMRYDVAPDGTATNGTVFFDMTSARGEDAIDGIKVDVKGNLYVSGPGGLFILSPEGKHLGTIVASRHPHNFAWGDDDGKSLYLCAKAGLYRIRLNVPGIRP